MSSVSPILTETDVAPGTSYEAPWLTPREILEKWYPGLTDDEYDRLLTYQHRDRERYRFKNYRVAPLTAEESDDHLRILEKCIAVMEAQLAARPKKKHAGYVLGAREFTLTYSPAWMSDVEARDKMKLAITKLLRYYRDDIVEFRAVGEVGSNGLSHIHAFYQLTGGLKITDKNFKRAWPHWNPKKKLGKGFEGGHHETVKEASDFKGYMEKDADTAWFDYTHEPRLELTVPTLG